MITDIWDFISNSELKRHMRTFHKSIAVVALSFLFFCIRSNFFDSKKVIFTLFCKTKKKNWKKHRTFLFAKTKIPTLFCKKMVFTKNSGFYKRSSILRRLFCMEKVHWSTILGGNVYCNTFFVRKKFIFCTFLWEKIYWSTFLYEKS